MNLTPTNNNTSSLLAHVLHSVSTVMTFHSSHTLCLIDIDLLWYCSSVIKRLTYLIVYNQLLSLSQSIAMQCMNFPGLNASLIGAFLSSITCNNTQLLLCNLSVIFWRCGVHFCTMTINPTISQRGSAFLLNHSQNEMYNTVAVYSSHNVLSRILIILK